MLRWPVIPLDFYNRDKQNCRESHTTRYCYHDGVVGGGASLSATSSKSSCVRPAFYTQNLQNHSYQFKYSRKSLWARG